MFDMLSNTNKTKIGWNHVWLIDPLCHYSYFPNVRWVLQTMVSKTNKQIKQIHRFSTLIVDYKFVSKTFCEWTCYIDVQHGFLWFSDKYNFNLRLKVWIYCESRIFLYKYFAFWRKCHRIGFPWVRLASLRKRMSWPWRGLQTTQVTHAYISYWHTHACVTGISMEP